MRSRFSAKQMELDKEEPRLSGAYIRSFVKNLTSTTVKDPSDGDGGSMKNVNENGECFGEVNSTQKPETQPPQHKKQVRRRLHTSRPYQERLMNMAEARREIVTALKFHRASMKQAAATNHDLQLTQSPPPPPPPPPLGQERKSKSRKNSSLYPATTATAATTTTTNYPPYYWPISTIAPPPPPSYHDNLDLVLPNQTLGLNLNFQNFNNLDTKLYHNSLSMYSSSASSTPSTSSSAAVFAAEEVAVGKPKESGSNSSGGRVGGSGLHHAMDEEEMEEIRSLGEQHQMEWNDTINLVTSVRWCKFLKTMEIEPEDGKVSTYEDDDYDGFHPFDRVMEFPSWLINSNERDCLQQHFDDHFADSCLQDPALPCMDIGEIEGMDGEWLA